MKRLSVNTPLGIIEFSAENGRLCSALFTEGRTSSSSDGFLNEIKEVLLTYFESGVLEHSIPLDPIGTDFQKMVWNELLNIPLGKTISYLDLAKKCGGPTYTRAVASANAKNPISILIPCHRVIGADGSLTGYAGGLERKKFLLELEGARNQLSLF